MLLNKTDYYLGLYGIYKSFVYTKNKISSIFLLVVNLGIASQPNDTFHRKVDFNLFKILCVVTWA